ncbi:MAG: M81 family metallopeptidase [Candidatus Bathyarchaeia archaeon]
MKFRVAVGGFGAESNSFSVESPVREPKEKTFDRNLLLENFGKKTTIGGFLEVLAKAGLDIFPTSRIFWGPTGIISRESYEHYKSELIRRLENAGKVDGILLDLHGAMVVEGYLDGEGILLKEIREALGEVPVVAVLDIHGNITDLKVNNASALIGYKTNPHVDLYERGKDAAKLLISIMKGRVDPVVSLKRLPMLGPNLGMSTWSYNPKESKNLPFARIMRRIMEIERDPRILNISAFIGFPYSDIPESVTSVLAIANADSKLAGEVADLVAEMTWESRNEFIKVRPLIPVNDAVDMAINAPEGPVILVDVGDNAGGGAPCDNTVILEALLRKGAEDAVVPLRDPEAVARAITAGVGSTIEVDVGGKIDGRFYKPIRVRACVKVLSDGKYIIRGPHHGGYMARRKVLPKEAWKRADVGKTALLEVDGIEIIVSEGKVGMEQDYYKAAGVDPSQRKIVIVKSHQAHRASFESIAKRIIEVDTPGSTSPSYKGLTFKNIIRPVFPLDPI